MQTRRVIVVGCVMGGMMIVTGPADATVENLKMFKQAYPGKESKAYSCKVCHTNAVGRKGDLNSYGRALEKAATQANVKTLTVEQFRAIEDQDADQDGVTNGDELKSGTNPADPASVPAGAPRQQSAQPAQPSAQPAQSGSSQQSAPAQAQPSEPITDRPEKPSSRWNKGGVDIKELVESLITTPGAWADTDGSSKQGPGSESSGKESTGPPIAEYVGSETCASCHTKQAKEFAHSTHARINIPGDTIKAQGCEMCHGPGSLHVAAGGGRGVGGIVNPRKDPSACFACHLDKKAEFRLPHHHPLLEGKMSCIDCHSAHGEEVRPWSATSMKDINEACFRCHKEQRGPFVWEHEALREGCTTCHKVHGSIHEKMLVARDNNLCLRCHTQIDFR